MRKLLVISVISVAIPLSAQEVAKPARIIKKPDTTEAEAKPTPVPRRSIIDRLFTKPTPAPTPKPTPAPAAEKPKVAKPKPKPKPTPKPGEEPAETPAPTEKPATPEKPEKPAKPEKPTPKPTEEPKVTEPAKPAESPEKPVDKPADKPAEKPAEKPEPAKPAKGTKGAKPAAEKPVPAKPEKPDLTNLDEPAKYQAVKAFALKEEALIALKTKADSTIGPEEAKQASIAYNRALFRKVREIEPSLDAYVDKLEQAVLKRVK